MKSIPVGSFITVILFSVFTAIICPVFSQQTIEVKTSTALISKGSQPCYVVQIPQADLKTVQQNWIKKLQEGNKAKVKEINEELVFLGAVKPEIIADSINIYSLLIQSDSMITLNMFVETDTIFFGPKADKTDLASDRTDNNIKTFLRSFAVAQYKLAVGDELEAQEKILKTMEKDLEKMEKDEENMTKEISNLENEIEGTEREIQALDNKIELKDQEINTHNTSMLGIGLEADKKIAQDKQKQLEKEKKDLEKERVKAKDKISSYKSDIKKNEKGIEDSQEQQGIKQQEITNQTEVVNNVKIKLNGIK